MRRFIVGTDWWSDCDDAVAMRLLLSAHKRGEIEVAGIAIDACMKYSVASLDGFLCKEGVRDIPVGLDLEADDFGSLETYRARYQPTLAEYAENLKKNEDVGDALKLYRKILAESDGKVEIMLGKENGARAFGLASDEKERCGVNDVKRTRLVKAGADIICGDFLEKDKIFEFLGL